MTTTTHKDNSSSAAPGNEYLRKYPWSEPNGGAITFSHPLPQIRNLRFKQNATQTSKNRTENEPGALEVDESTDPAATTSRSLRSLLDTIGAPQDPNRDEVLAMVRGFESLVDGWDGVDSLQPKPNVIEDALTVLQYWPVSLSFPEPEVSVVGTISLELFDEHGFTTGGIELLGEHLAVYSVVNDERTIAVDRFSVIDTGQLLGALHSMQRALSSQ